ncbi:DUF4845 domain-containing protein [Balneatrix alpica]|uniref:DUF4845 domain-containing protein n=1 Tax=Balneatrix alpica TaxID=75684 RepID=A0ABV5Z9G5_9GAMM|nr:DUF4845 domain-containing protein [Balneatrix alpica]
MQSLLKQRGASVGTLLNVLILIIGVIIAAKVVPLYMADSAVKASLEATLADTNQLKRGQNGIQEGLSKRLQINSVDLPQDALSIKRAGNVWQVRVEYERRVALVANAELALTFNHYYEAKLP